MITTTPAFDAAAKVMPMVPVFRFSVDGYSKVFVYRPTGRVNEVAWIAKIDDWSVSVDPRNGSYTIDPLNIHVLDYKAAVTYDVGLLLLEGRRCTLEMGFDGLGLTDYCLLFQGIVSTVTSQGGSEYTFSCADYNRLNQRLIFAYGDSGTVTSTTTTYNPNHPYTIITTLATTDKSTGQVTTTGYATYSDTGAPHTPGTFHNTSGGYTTTTVITSRVVNFGQGNVTIYESTVTTVGSNTVMVTTLTQMGSQLYTNIVTTTLTNQVTKLVTSSVDVTYTENGTVGTSQITDYGFISGTNPKRLVGHPLDILLSILQVEIGYADSDINLALIEAYRDSVFTGIEFDFIITGSVDAKDFIENQLLKPLAGYLFSNSTGQLCVGFAQPLNGGLVAVAALNPYNLTTLPDLQAAELINVVTIRFDKDDAGVGTSVNSTGFLAEANTYYSPSIQDLNDLTGQVAQQAVTGASAVQGQLIIESDGMRSGFQGFLLSKVISNAIFALYGSYNPMLDAQTHWVPCFKAELAEYVTLTHPLLPNRATGKMGVTNQLFQIVKRSYSFDSLSVTLSLQDASNIAAFGALKIAPDSEAAYTAASANDQGTYLFMSTQDSKQSTGVAAGKLG